MDAFLVIIVIRIKKSYFSRNYSIRSTLFSKELKSNGEELFNLPTTASIMLRVDEEIKAYPKLGRGPVGMNS